MIFKNFRLQIILRILFLGFSLAGLILLLIETHLYATIALLVIFIIYQMAALIKYTETTNRRLSQFLQSVRHADFSQSFSIKGLGSSFAELNRAFSDVMDDFRKIREEKEEHYRYLQTVVQHVGIGLIAFHEDGEVVLANNAAKRLLKRPQLRRIQYLKAISPVFAKTLMHLKAGKHILAKINLDGDLMQLAIYATEFSLRGQMITLVSLQNIRSELEEQEMEAWQKLIRVLTHEIMNSITPISSMAGTASEILKEMAPVPHDGESLSFDENLQDVRTAIQTIQKRSQGLLQFVEAYRSLTRLPSPKFEEFAVAELFGRVQSLMEESYKEKKIDFQCQVIPAYLKLTADPALIEQVIINLLRNAADAVSELDMPQVELRSYSDEKGRVVILVSDNGPGISQDLQEKIFIPFFTTKKEGSGIGLSLSRQIMRMHKGDISVTSQPGSFTVFKLTF
jgi:two-component system nitrogen regulation sensor histidine kinase NtrY